MEQRVGTNKRRAKILTAAAAALWALAALLILLCATACTATGNTGGNGLQFSDLIASGAKYSIELKEVIVCPAQGEFKIAQGAASDGKYAYFVMRKDKNGDCIICKYDLRTGRHVKTSDPIYLFHGNDMTYDSKTNLLYVAHGSSEGKILTAVDPATLTVAEQTVDIEKGCGAISYSAGRDQFAISQGGKKLHFFDGDLNWLSSYDRVDDTTFTAQGMGSDETYVYFPMSSEYGGNFIEIYDWDGNYVGHVLVEVDWESESMFWVNNTYYLAFNSDNCAKLYRMEFTLTSAD